MSDDSDFVFDEPDHRAPEPELHPADMEAVSAGPSHPDSELHLLSAVVTDSSLLAQLPPPEAFTDFARAFVARTLLRMARNALPIAADTLAQELMPRLPELGGTQFLLDVTGASPTTAHFQHHLRKVCDAYSARRALRLAQEIKDASGDPELLAAVLKRAPEVLGAGSPTLPARPLTDFRILPKNDRSVLIGNRWLSKGDIAILASTSGMGKSSFSLQAAITWALGRPLFGGFEPNGPLETLIFQSEDGDGDVAEAWESICYGMRLSTQERELAAQRVRIVTDRVNRGSRFIEQVRRHIAKRCPHLLVINPLLAFLDGDVNEARDVGKFIREELNGLNEPAKFGILIVHHTAKPPTQKADRKWNEVMYEMAGSADLTNAARAILSLQADPDHEGCFALHAAKRGRRAGIQRKATSESGVEFMQPVTKIGIRHSTERFVPPGSSEELPVIFWEPWELPAKQTPKEAGQKGGRPTRYDFEDYRCVFPPYESEGKPFAQLLKLCEVNGPIPRGTFQQVLKRWCDQGFVVRIAEVGKPAVWKASL